MHCGVRREFIGFNRARHAVLEAAIYATRVHMLSRDLLLSEVERLQVIVDKTAGPRELEAMALLADYIRSAPETPPTHAVPLVASAFRRKDPEKP